MFANDFLVNELLYSLDTIDNNIVPLPMMHRSAPHVKVTHLWLPRCTDPQSS